MSRTPSLPGKSPAERQEETRGHSVAKMVARGYTRTWVKGKAVWLPPDQQVSKNPPHAIKLSHETLHLLGRIWLILGRHGTFSKQWHPKSTFSLSQVLEGFFASEKVARFCLDELHSEFYDWTLAPHASRKGKRSRAAHARFLALEAGARPDPLAAELLGPQAEPGEAPPLP